MHLLEKSHKLEEFRPSPRKARISELWAGHTLSKGDLRSAGFLACGFPELSSSVFHGSSGTGELGTGKSPKPAGWKAYATSDNSEMRSDGKVRSPFSLCQHR